MGASGTFCCSQDDRKNFLKAYINNMRLTGIDGIGDLALEECNSKYKNRFESELNMTSEGILRFYDSILEKFSHIKNPDQNRYAKLSVKVIT